MYSLLTFSILFSLFNPNGSVIDFGAWVVNFNEDVKID